MNRKIVILIFAMMALTILWGACAGARAKSYDVMTGTMLQHYRNERFNQALASADQLVKRTEKRQKQDRFLALLERGKVALAAGYYDTAIRDLQTAERRFIKIEGTISIEESNGALFSNELGKEYEVEPYEMIAISPYLALAYLAKGDFSGARVERNRTIYKINRYLSRTKKTHLENPFARYISALIYEMDGKIDDVRIEFRKMVKDFAHLAYLKKEYSIIKKRLKKEKKKRSTDLVVLIDVGVVPQKYEVKYGPHSVRIDKVVATIKFAYAKLRRVYSSVTDCEVAVDGKNAFARLLYNLEETVIKQDEITEKPRFNSLYKRVFAKLAASVGTQLIGRRVKGNAGAAISILGNLMGKAMAYMERADLRSWSTLPKEILYCRIRDLKPGKTTVNVAYSGMSRDIPVNLNEAKVNVLYVAVPR